MDWFEPLGDTPVAVDEDDDEEGGREEDEEEDGVPEVFITKSRCQVTNN